MVRFVAGLVFFCLVAAALAALLVHVLGPERSVVASLLLWVFHSFREVRTSRKLRADVIDRLDKLEDNARRALN